MGVGSGGVGIGESVDSFSYIDEWTPTGGDAIINLGDNAGVNKFIVRDSDAVNIFAVDSNGFLVMSGAIDQTIANTGAGGDRGINLSITHDTNALTGTLVGVRSNARVNIDSSSGRINSGEFKAGNTSVGYDMHTVVGVYAEVVNKTPSGAKTWTNARAFEANMDLNQGSAGNTTTFTNAAILYGIWNLPTAGTYTTVTNGYGVFIRNEQVGGNGQMLDAGFYLDDLNMGGGVKGWDFGIDFSGIESTFGTADIRGSQGETLDNSTDGSWTSSGDLILTGSAGVKLSGADGVLTVSGLGDGNDLDILWDFDNHATATTIGVSSGAATIIDWGSIGHTTTGPVIFANATTALTIGNGSAGIDYRILFDGQSNDGIILFNEGASIFQINTAVDIDGALTASTFVADTTIGGTTITASVGFALGDGDYVGITNNEVIVFNAAGTIKVQGADFYVGGTAADGILPSFNIVGDADSDGGVTVSDTLKLVLVAAADPTDALWTFTSTQSAGYSFDKRLAFPSLDLGSSTVVTGVLDEDNMTTNSAVDLATQQSIKAYVDAAVATVDTWDEVMHLGNSFTIANTENLSATINQNDVTNNPAALVITNTGSGNDITLPSASIKAGTFSGVDVSISNDLLIATAGEINWNSTDKLIHSANTMTLAGFTTWDFTTVATIDFNAIAVSITGLSSLDIDAGFTASTIVSDGKIQTLDGQTFIMGTDNDITMGWNNTSGVLEIKSLDAVPVTLQIMADRGDDNGDTWQWEYLNGGVLTLANDASGAQVTHMTFTPNATVTSSTFDIVGNFTAGTISSDADMVVGGAFRYGAAGSLTISAGGAIAVTKSYHTIVVTGGAGSGADQLDTATGGAEGDILILKAQTTGANDQVTVADGAGADTFILAGGAAFVMDHIDDRIALIHNGTEWVEFSRSGNS